MWTTASFKKKTHYESNYQVLYLKLCCNVESYHPLLNYCIKIKIRAMFSNHKKDVFCDPRSLVCTWGLQSARLQNLPSPLVPKLEVRRSKPSQSQSWPPPQVWIQAQASLASEPNPTPGGLFQSLSLFTEVPRSLNVGKMLLSFFFFFPKEQSQYIWMDEFVRPFVCSLSTETMAFQNPCLMCAYPFWEYR